MENKNPTTIVIFGASGDLTKRKLLPALYQLTMEKLLPENLKIVGFARSEKSHEAFRAEMKAALVQFSRSKPQDGTQALQAFVSRLYYQSGSYDNPESFQTLRNFLDKLHGDQDNNSQHDNRLYYLSTPPTVFWKIISTLGETGHIAKAEDQTRWTRVIIEKPFGQDLASAIDLNRKILSVLNENQVYRIDHYLGKETVQNIMTFRFGNSIFEPLWNRRYIDHVQITVSEAVAVGSRGGYYDHSGAIRDMVQNHILQLLALVAMEPPASFVDEAVRDEKVKVLKALRPIPQYEIAHFSVRGQYTGGEVNGKPILNFLDEKGVQSNSHTETFVALKTFIDNWRWANVPFYIRTGKAMAERLSEITILFRQPPLALFKHKWHEGHVEGDQMHPNTLTLRVQPDEAIRLNFGLKIPGSRMMLQPTDMEFCYSDVFHAEPPEAYERLILDSILGDSTLFIRHDEVEAAWKFVDNIVRGWEQDKVSTIKPYQAGSWGPKASHDLLEQSGRRWLHQ